MIADCRYTFSGNKEAASYQLTASEKFAHNMGPNARICVRHGGDEVSPVVATYYNPSLPLTVRISTRKCMLRPERSDFFDVSNISCIS